MEEGWLCPRHGKTKNLVVYEKLRQKIIKGTIKPGQITQEHEQIIEALSTADVDRADRLVKEQKKKSLKALQNYMVQLNTASPEMLEEIWQNQVGR